MLAASYTIQVASQALDATVAMAHLTISHDRRVLIRGSHGCLAEIQYHIDDVLRIGGRP